MRDILVAVDLETTGLNPFEDRIIEIGALKVRDDTVLEEWHSLVNPGLPIPPHVTRLTGIRDEDVAAAPSLRQVLPQLRRFVGNHPLIGHNISFDVAFLRHAGLSLDNPVADTYLLASTLLPGAPRYSLYALASMFDISTEGAHRALHDVRMTYRLYRVLWERILHLPLDILAEIVRSGRQMPWNGQIAFEAALRERGQEVAQPYLAHSATEVDEELAELFGTQEQPSASLRPRRTPEPIDVEQAVALLKPEGALASVLQGYEFRPQQAEMLRAVADAFNRGQHVMVEAPTGVGKTMAYLVPAVYFATRNDDRVIISTNTINLQDQLIKKDIPLLRSALGVPFRAAVLKGRSNYLCPRRLAALRRRGPTSPEEMQMLARVLVWLITSQSGDRGELTLRGPAEAAVWQRLSAEDEGCTMERCMTQMGGTCPFYQARRAAEGAHLVIVNHALLLSDIVAEGHVLPDYRYLIVDEAHHLEEATTNGLSFRTDPAAISRQLAELGTANTGLLGEVLQRTRGVIPPEYFASLQTFVNMVVDAAAYMNRHVEAFFQVLRRFLEEHTQVPRSEYTQQIRIIAAMRTQPAWSGVETYWDNLSKFTSGIADAMMRLAGGLRELGEYEIEEYDDLLAGISAAARHLAELHQRLEQLVMVPDANTVYWVEFQPDGERISVHAAPLDVGPLVQRYLWHGKETVIMTSATLRSDGSFSYIRERLDADAVEEVVVDSPFDYESSTLLYLVNDIPEPSEQAYQRAVEQGVVSLCRATEGRALILFTSYAQLRQTAKAVSGALAQSGIVVYDQSDGSSRSQLMEGFIESEKAVLMGTRSFWEGIDVPGENLSALVIVRLPFSVPTDPLFAARSELFDNPFVQYAIPETILRFRQGFGRLIRRKDDRGVVAIFDRRVLTKQYGRLFLDALPRCTVRRGRMIDLPDAAARWLARG